MYVDLIVINGRSLSFVWLIELLKCCFNNFSFGKIGSVNKILRAIAVFGLDISSKVNIAQII
jgi:hypothetical protein